MDNCLSDAPIERLPPEILATIFFENVSDSNGAYLPLNTARSCSQVCQQWRDILLSLSSLWGRLININILFDTANERWRNEVLKRSGSALLWIRGDWDIESPERRQVFLSFLEKNWERIEKINIMEDISQIDYSWLRDWEGLESRAPNLKYFVLDIDWDGSSYRYRLNHSRNPRTQRLLFKGGAPHLRKISTWDLQSNIGSSWLHHIRDLTLTTHYSIQEVFQILSATPLLTDLNITMIKYKRTDHILQAPHADKHNITLALLETFALSAYFDVAISILQCLDIPASCIPNIVLNDSTNQGWGSFWVYSYDPRLKILQDEVVKVMRRHLDCRRLTCMKIVWRNSKYEKLYFSGHDRPTDISCVLSLYGEVDSRAMLRDLSICDYLPPVKELELNVEDLSPQYSYLAKFPQSLQSLTTLITTEDTLKFYVEVDNANPGDLQCFPSLKVLKLTSLGPQPSSGKNKYFLPVIWNFFQLQISGESPISVFDLTRIRSSDLYDMEYLENVVGLQTVRWRAPDILGDLEYHCGSGQSKVLRFKQNRQSKSRGKVEFKKKF